MTFDPKTKPEARETFGDETPEDSKGRELTLEELASVSGGNDEIFYGQSQGPDWNTDG